MSDVFRWSATLTDRQRVLLHTQPLIMMRHNWLTRDDDLKPYDPLCLTMKVFEILIDQSGFGNEVTRETILRELMPILRALDSAAGVEPRIDRYTRSVDRLLGGLMNDSQRGESFMVEYSDFGPNQTASRRSLSFKLIREIHGYSGEIALQMSSEAINLFLNALDLDIESEQIANEAVVQFQLQRGNFDKARAGAEAARGRSLQYEQKIHRIVEQTKRDIRQVDWRHEAHTALVDANDHVEGRLRIEESVIRSARQKLASIADDGDNHQSLRDIVRLMDDCRSRHLRLNKRLMTARSEFIEQQSRQCFVESLRTEPINLRDDLLAPILSLPSNDAVRISEDTGHAFIGPVMPGVLSLHDLVLWQLQPKRIELIGESEAEKVEAIEANVERQRVDDDVSEHCERFLEGFSGVVGLSDLLIRLEEHACPEAVQDAVTLRVLEHFDPEDDHSIRGINVTIIGPDDLHSKRCTGDDLVIDALNRATGN